MMIKIPDVRLENVEFVKPIELAKLLGISRSYIYILIRFGRISARRLLGRIVIDKDVADEFMEEFSKNRRVA